MIQSNRFRWSRLGTLLALVWLLAACGALPPTATVSPEPTATPTAALAPPSAVNTRHQITFCFYPALGALDAPSHNSAIWAGVQQGASAIGANATNFAIQEAVDFGHDIDQLIAGATDILVVEAGASQVVALDAARKYPSVYFIGLDLAIDPHQATEMPPNYAGLVFAEDQAGFLAGALAAQITHTRKVGALVGFSALPVSWRFGEGYRAGVRYIDSAIDVQVEYHDDVDITRAFSDPVWGQAHVQRQLASGRDVLFAAASTTSDGALGTVVTYQRQSGQPIFVIGTEIDQYEQLPDVRAVLVSSAMRKVGPGVAALIQSIGAGTFRGGMHTGEVGLAPYHDLAGQVPAVVQARLQEITKNLNDGSLQTKVPASKDAAP